MLMHLQHFFDAPATAAAHAADIFRFAGEDATALAPRLLAEAARAGGAALRLPLLLPTAMRDLLLAWFASLALLLAPPLGWGRSTRDSDVREPNVAAPRRGAARRQIRPGWIDPGDGRPRLFIDLTDLLTHALWHASCAGIPRVQLALASELLRKDANVFAVGLHRQKWFDLGGLVRAGDGNVDRTFALIKESFTEFSWSRTGALRFARRRLRRLPTPCGQMPDIGAADSLFIGGAFWTDEILDLCRRAAANGANLVILFHDLIPLAMPSFTGHDFAQAYREALRLPAHFVVTSEANRSALKQARRDIEGGSQRTCSTVVPLADEFHGAPRRSGPGAPPRRLRLLAETGFALCVGTIEIRKNHGALLDVWQTSRPRPATLPRSS